MLLFADDVVLFMPSREGLEHVFLAFESFCNANGLNISGEKTEILLNKHAIKHSGLIPDQSTVLLGKWEFKVVG